MADDLSRKARYRDIHTQCAEIEDYIIWTTRPLNKPAAEEQVTGGVEESAPATATRHGTFVQSITLDRRIPVRTNPKALLYR